MTSGGTIPDRGLFGVFLVGDERPVAGRRARRGDGLRVAGRRRVHARLDLVADRGHHPRPGAGHPGARASPAGCRSGRATRSAARSSWAGRSARSSASSAALPPTRRARAGAGRRARRRGPPTTCSPTSPSSARRPATCPTTGPSSSSGSATSSATGGWRSTRRSGRRCTRRGRWSSRPGCASATASTCRRCTPTTASCCGCPTSSSTRARRARTGTEMARLEPDEVEPLVTAEVGGSALFASRFRECAARALLLPRRDPGRRQPLWQQRQRSAQLLVGGQRVRLVPDRARDGARVPAGRLRRARAGRPDARRRGAQGALVEVETPAAVAVRPVAAVRLRRAVPLRGRLAAGRAPRARRCRSTRRCSPSCSGSRATALRELLDPDGGRRARAPSCSGCPTTAGPATPRTSPTCCGCSAR